MRVERNMVMVKVREILSRLVSLFSRGQQFYSSRVLSFPDLDDPPTIIQYSTIQYDAIQYNKQFILC